MEIRTDIANRAPDVYARSAPVVLDKVHSPILQTHNAKMKKRPSPRTITVIGPGEYVLPWSQQYHNYTLGKTNRNLTKNLVGPNGNFVLLDYVAENGKGLQKAREVLRQNGFFEKGYFLDTARVIDIAREEVKISRSSRPRVHYFKGNICEDIHLPYESADSIDMTLSMHHATKTRARLRRICKKCFDFLKPGGLLHIGEGNVDMNYIEDKLIKFGADVSSFSRKPILMADLRGTTIENLEEKLLRHPKAIESLVGPDPMFFLFHPDRIYRDLPEVECPTTLEKSPTIIISEGGIEIKHRHLLEKSGKEKISRFLMRRGYGLAHHLPSSLLLQLINPKLQSDTFHFLSPVSRFYSEIISKAERIKGKDPELFDKILDVVGEEAERASCGDTEHYIGREKIIQALQNTGFTNIEIICHNAEPFYNLVAHKPN